MDELYPWVRVIVVVRQDNNWNRPPVLGHRWASVHDITTDADHAQHQVVALGQQAERDGHPLPELAASQTVWVVPLPGNIVDLIRRLTDPDVCTFDHGGDCQAHGFGRVEFVGGQCPHAAARALLERINHD